MIWRIAVALLAAVLLSQPIAAQEYDEIEQLIIQRALYHGANPTQLLRVARCESKLYPYARNPRSGASFIFQWLPPANSNAWSITPAWRIEGINLWTEYQNGNPDAIYYDIDQAAWMFAHGYSYQWSCK